MPTIIITGDAAADRALKEFATNAQRRIVRKATREGLRPVLTAAKANAPRKSGRLRKSIKLRAMKRSRTKVGARITTGTAGSDFQGKTYYGAFQEFGWRVGKRAKEVRRAQNFTLKRKVRAPGESLNTAIDNRRQIPGRKYMANAAETKRDQAQAIFRRVVQEEIEIEAAKLRNK